MKFFLNLSFFVFQATVSFFCLLYIIFYFIYILISLFVWNPCWPSGIEFSNHFSDSVKNSTSISIIIGFSFFFMPQQWSLVWKCYLNYHVQKLWKFLSWQRMQFDIADLWIVFHLWSLVNGMVSSSVWLSEASYGEMGNIWC